MSGTWDRIHDAALTRHEDGGAELARLVIDADDVFETLKAENERLREAVLDAAAHLVAATSLLRAGGKKAAPSDKMFEQMLADYEAAIERTRAALQENTND